MEDVELRSYPRRSERIPTETYELIQPHRISNGDTRLPGQPRSRTNPRRWSSFRRAVTNLWVFEILCWLLALGCLTTIIALLYSFNGQRVPEWASGITLNAVVSILATVTVFSLMVPVAAGLGQLKWLRMRHKRPLMDFELIENAGRGPAGSILLLLHCGGGYLACLGAILTLAMLAIGPFFQQIVKTTTLTIKSSGASVPVAYSYAYSSTSYGVSDADVDLRTKSAIISGLLSANDSSDQFVIPHSCTTGNCTWPDYYSLAVCYTCADLTKTLTVSVEPSSVNGSAPNILHKLSNGVALKTYENQLGIQMTVNNTMDEYDGTLSSIAFMGHNSSLVDMFVIALDNRTTMDGYVLGPYATECILEFCVQDYTAVERNGTFTETRKGKVVTIGNLIQTSYQVQHDGRIFKVGWNTLKAFGFYFSTLFTGRVSFANSLSPVPIFPSEVTQSIWLHLKDPPHTLDSMFRNIEQSMTRAVRTQPSTRNEVDGQSLTQQTIIRVAWAWISLPVALLILAFLFLSTVIVYTRQSGLHPWKESSIAVLFHGLYPRSSGKLHGLTHRNDMDDVAQRFHVRLNVDENGQFLERIRSVT